MNGDVMNMLSSIMQDPKAMEKAMSMANMLASSGMLDGLLNKNEEQKEAPTQSVDSNALKDIISSLPSNEGEDVPSKSKGQISTNERLALLCAIRPYLKDDKAQKLDSVIRIMKIVGTLEKSGIKLF